MPSQKQKKTFSMGAVAFLTLACSAGLIVHAFLAMYERGGGLLMFISAVIAAGYLYVDYIHGWCSWWATEEKEDKPVIYTAFAAAAVIALTMIVSGGAVMIHYVLKKESSAELRTKEAASKSESSIRQNEEAAKLRSQTEAEQQFSIQLQQLKASGATQRTINQFIQSHQKRQEQELLSMQSAKPMALLPTSAPAESAESKPNDIGKDFVAVLDSFARFWVFVVPTLVAFLGYSIVTFALLAPGGATTTKTTDGKSRTADGEGQTEKKS